MKIRNSFPKDSCKLKFQRSKIQDNSQDFGFRQQTTMTTMTTLIRLLSISHVVQHPLSPSVSYCYSLFGTFLSSYHPQTIPSVTAVAVVLVLIAAVSFTTSTTPATAIGTNLPQDE
jgi:hypothetical protein